MQFEVVCRSEELPDGGKKIVAAGGRTVALFRVGGRIYAVDNRCPHRGGDLGGGELEGTVVYCPLHFWSFDLLTGRSVRPPGASVMCFEVREHEGRIEVGPEAEAAPGARDC